MAFKLLETFREILNGHKDESGKQKIYATSVINKQRLMEGQCIESASGSEVASPVHYSELTIPSS